MVEMSHKYLRKDRKNRDFEPPFTASSFRVFMLDNSVLLCYTYFSQNIDLKRL